MFDTDEERRHARLVVLWVVGTPVAAAFMTALSYGVAHLTGGVVTFGFVEVVLLNLVLWGFALFFIIKPYW